MAVWKVATVQFNYHIAVEKNHYSVPYEYLRHKVDVRLTKNTVEIFYSGNRIASHVRILGCSGRYSSVVEHMPRNHQDYTQWNAPRFIRWAAGIGANTEAVVRSILASRRVEEQGYKACLALLKLADRYSVSRLEEACKRALCHTASPGFKSIQTILRTGSDRANVAAENRSPESPSGQGFTRGAEYYGRNG